MRGFQIGAALGLVVAFWVPSVGLAQSQPTLIGGSVEPVITDACYVGRGYVTYDRDFRTSPRPGTKSVVALPEIFVGLRSSGQVWDLQGQAVLNFKTHNSGTILFKQSDFAGSFWQYAERRGQANGPLNVSFVLSLPDKGCTLPIRIELEQSAN